MGKLDRVGLVKEGGGEGPAKPEADAGGAKRNPVRRLKRKYQKRGGTTVTESMPEGRKKATYSVRIDQDDLVKILAYYRRVDKKDILDEALEVYFEANRSEVEAAVDYYDRAGME